MCVHLVLLGGQREAFGSRAQVVGLDQSHDRREPNLPGAMLVSMIDEFLLAHRGNSGYLDWCL